MRIHERMEVRERIKKTVRYLFDYEYDNQAKEFLSKGVSEEQLPIVMTEWLDAQAYLISLEPHEMEQLNGIKRYCHQ